DLATPLKNNPDLGGLIMNLVGNKGMIPAPQRAVDASPVTYVSKHAPPFLIMHGDKDTTVPLSQSETLANALKRAGTDYTFTVVPGAGHGLTATEVTNSVIPFFDGHLKGSSSK